ncbi:MAG TPA: arginine--tRNA ligase, partial [Phycisphaerales bacterium]|nr:arginine--tRNA ligase [Phycisphaerales bacterium]
MIIADHAAPIAESSNPVQLLNSLFLPALASLEAPAPVSLDPAIKPAQNPSFGDYQANCAMALAKSLAAKPHDVAKKILASLPPSALEVIEPPTIAGPGFINIKLKSSALAQLLESQSTHALGVPASADTHPIVVDLCGVNVAKQMHVGHLRATIIGDSLARVFSRLGRTVQRENHLGDWGLPIALVLHHLRSKGANLDTISIEDLDSAYRDAQS